MTDEQVEHVMQAVQDDAIYRDFLHLESVYKPHYLRILEILPPEDRFYLKMYISIQIAKEERLTRTAYFMTPQNSGDARSDE